MTTEVRMLAAGDQSEVKKASTAVFNPSGSSDDGREMVADCGDGFHPARFDNCKELVQVGWSDIVV
jgi:hypothetical protein